MGGRGLCVLLLPVSLLLLEPQLICPRCAGMVLLLNPLPSLEPQLICRCCAQVVNDVITMEEV